MEDYFKSISADAEVLTDKWPCSMCIFNDKVINPCRICKWYDTNYHNNPTK